MSYCIISVSDSIDISALLCESEDLSTSSIGLLILWDMFLSFRTNEIANQGVDGAGGVIGASWQKIMEYFPSVTVQSNREGQYTSTSGIGPLFYV